MPRPTITNETPLTPLQDDAMRCLANYAGQGPITVQTSMYDKSGLTGVALYPPDWNPVAIGLKMTTLRGLQNRGRIKIVDSYWRGATIEVL